MASGVKANPECFEKFKELCEGQKTHSFVIFKMSDDLKEIVVDRTGARKKDLPGDHQEQQAEGKLVPCCKLSHQELYEDLTGPNGKQCRYAVFDMQYDEGSTSKILLITWCPEGSPIKQKMLYTSSKGGFKLSLNFTFTEVQCNDADDLSWDSLYNKASQHSRKH